MPLSRYSSKNKIINNNEMYDELFRERGVRDIIQIKTITLNFPSNSDIQNIAYEPRRWKSGDRLYKLASEFYGNPSYWWIIAQFNKKPTESHFKVGDIFYIPVSADVILQYYGI